MNVPLIQTNKTQPTFGILKGYKKTPYGEYTWGEYKGYKIEVFDAKKSQQKLIYVSDNKLLKWIKSKFIYFLNDKKRVILSENKRINYLS